MGIYKDLQRTKYRNIFICQDHLSKYHLGIDINSKTLKDKLIEIDIKFKFEDEKKVKKIIF